MNKCYVETCDRPVKYKGLCKKHYKRQWRHGDPEKTLINMDPSKRETCKAPDCDKIASLPSTGLCKTHHLRWIRHGRLHTVRAAHGQGRPKTAAGYVLLTRDGKRIYEHIYLAEKVLGKPLPAKVVVHHMNEKPDDNLTPFNLIVCPDQAYHLLLHRRMEEYKKYGYCKSLEL